jgi:hypothetical protein
MGTLTHFLIDLADRPPVNLFGRNDDTRTTEPSQTPLSNTQRTMLRAREQSRSHGRWAKFGEVSVELDVIEARLASLREHQAAFLFKAAAVKPQKGRVQTVDLRTLAEVDITKSQLGGATTKPDSATPTEGDEDDFDKRFAAFAAGEENDDLSRRWLDG